MIVKSLSAPDDSRSFLDESTRTRVDLASASIGRGVYRPGWRWSQHAGPLTGEDSSAHVGYVVSGRMIVRGPDGVESEIGPGDTFEAAPGHDAWVIGEEPCVALDFRARR